jgi:hypothetical protein
MLSESRTWNQKSTPTKRRTPLHECHRSPAGRLVADRRARRFRTAASSRSKPPRSQALAGRIDGAFTRACELMLACEGRIVVSGMGKSGHIARKIAATLASTGTPAFFVHPARPATATWA